MSSNKKCNDIIEYIILKSGIKNKRIKQICCSNSWGHGKGIDKIGAYIWNLNFTVLSGDTKKDI